MRKRWTMNRRVVLAGGASLLAAPMILQTSRASAQPASFKIGFVNPSTGLLAGFGAMDQSIMQAAQAAMAGTENSGQPVNVEIVWKDAQSRSNRAAEVTK